MGEIAFENACCDDATSRGFINRKMTYPGRRGCPDRWFFKEGWTPIVVEFKAPGGKLSPVQTREIRRLRHAGLDVHVVSTWKEWEALFK